MTVGIGVLCEGGQCVVLASDMRATYGTTNVSPSDTAGKAYEFPPYNLAATIAGSPSSTHAIISEFADFLRDLLDRNITQKKTIPNAKISFEEIRDALEYSRKKELRRLQSCAMVSDLGVNIQDWIAGKLPTGQPFNDYALREGLRVLRNVKREMWSKAAVIVAGFLGDSPVFFRGIKTDPIEEASTPPIHVIGNGAAIALEVLTNRKQNVEMKIARTLLHVHEALKAARKDKYIGPPDAYIVIRPRTAPTPNGLLRFNPEHPQLADWSKKYRLRGTEELDNRSANDLINSELLPHQPRSSQWLGAPTSVPDL